jgi:hypothetical protein
LNVESDPPRARFSDGIAMKLTQVTFSIVPRGHFNAGRKAAMTRLRAYVAALRSQSTTRPDEVLERAERQRAHCSAQDRERETAERAHAAK